MGLAFEIRGVASYRLGLCFSYFYSYKNKNKKSKAEGQAGTHLSFLAQATRQSK